MVSDSGTVALAVTIPVAFVLIVVISAYSFSRKSMKKDDQMIQNKLENIDLEADLTFDNYQQLAGPQSPLEKNHGFNTTNGNNVDAVPQAPADLKKSKSRYRTYSYHPAMRGQNDINLNSLNLNSNKESKPASTPETDYSSSTNATNPNSNTLPPSFVNRSNSDFGNGSSSTIVNGTFPPHVKRNSEQLLQNYFEGIVPVLGSETTKARNSSDDSQVLVPPPPAVVRSDSVNDSRSSSKSNSESHTDDGSSGTKKQSKAKTIFKRPTSFIGNSKSSVIKENASSSDVGSQNSKANNDHNDKVNSGLNKNNVGENSSDSINQQYFIRSLKKNARESHDFTMPIPGSARTSHLIDRKSPLASVEMRKSGSHGSFTDNSSKQGSNTKLSKMVNYNYHSGHANDSSNDFLPPRHPAMLKTRNNSISTDNSAGHVEPSGDAGFYFESEAEASELDYGKENINMEQGYPDVEVSKDQKISPPSNYSQSVASNTTGTTGGNPFEG
ncbi:hypothetical protein DASC09_049960 [Saccharomycopsis crataegensis]|uniref:Uncharacterized protein n=1 Tax=Saccharomycopsis crataegensis TaxID=43959 RepID=A0AAV5QT18_9ASCO|nr:hypothetical protein DASC09_049960 [Saccharomycopsis crataegensis]